MSKLIENGQASIDTIQESTITFNPEQSVTEKAEYDKLDKLIQQTKEQYSAAFEVKDENSRQIVDAGMTSREFNSLSRHENNISKSNRRTYLQKDEKHRVILKSEIKKKDFYYYNTKDKSCLWNETSKLAPSILLYSHENIDPKKTFKKSIRDLPKVEQQERTEKFNQQMVHALKSRHDSLERHSGRKLERYIQQYQSSQGLTDEQILQIKQIEEQDPQLFEELSNKKKFTFASKNSTRALKDQHLNINYWNLLNHAPDSQVKSIVTQRVLNMDKRSCDNLLNAILDEKKQDDTKQTIIQKERQIQRNKLALKHNQRIEQALKIGVKVKGQIHSHREPAEKNNSGERVADFKNNTFMFGALETDRSIVPQSTQRMMNRFQNSSISPNSRRVSEMNSIVENQLSQEKISLKTVFIEPKKYQASERIDVLAMPKPQYHGKDFFQRSEFRGLFLADHQEAIGERAFKCVDSLNQSTVSKFNSIGSFKESISQKKTIQQFYKNNTTLDPILKETYKTKAVTSIPRKRGDSKQQTVQNFASKNNSFVKDMISNFNRKIQTHEGKRLANFKTTTNVTPLEYDTKATDIYSYSKQMISNVKTSRQLDLIEDSTNTSKITNSARVDFIHKEPKSLSIAMSTLGQGKPQKGKPFDKLSLSTKFSNNFSQYQENMSLKLSGNQTAKGVFNSSVRQPLLNLNQVPNPSAIIKTARNELISIQDKSKSVTQIGREENQKYNLKHPVNQAIVSRQVVDGNERELMNVNINTVKSSKQGTIFY